MENLSLSDARNSLRALIANYHRLIAANDRTSEHRIVAEKLTKDGFPATAAQVIGPRDQAVTSFRQIAIGVQNKLEGIKSAAEAEPLFAEITAAFDAVKLFFAVDPIAADPADERRQHDLLARQRTEILRLVEYARCCVSLASDLEEQTLNEFERLADQAELANEDRRYASSSRLANTEYHNGLLILELMALIEKLEGPLLGSAC